jgi:YaiO family outer membrane protein
MNITAKSILAMSCLACSSPALAAGPASFNLDHVAYSGGRGVRSVATLDTVIRMSESTKALLTFGTGQRRAGGQATNAVRVDAALTHNWSGKFSSQTSLSLASSGTIFARSQFAQDLSLKLTDGFVATLGGKYSSWAGGDHVKALSAGASYYFPGLSASYRFSLFDSSKLGGSHTHLASLRLSDPHGRGATQLWVGAGTSLYDVNPTAPSKAGTFTSLALRREQPIGSRFALSAGFTHSWFRGPTGNYHADGFLVGFRLLGSPSGLRKSVLENGARNQN